MREREGKRRGERGEVERVSGKERGGNREKEREGEND